MVLGADAMYYNQSGTYNVAIGNATNQAGTSGSRNVHVGQQTGGYNTGTLVTAVGNQAGEGLANNTNAPSFSTLIGAYAGRELNTGSSNQFFGYNSGGAMSTGSNNVFVGVYNGQTGLDLRTSSNNVVLSDGEANIRLWFQGAVIARTAANASMFSVAQTWASSTDYDDLVWPGMFRVDNNATNAPSNSFFSVVVFGNGSNVVTQIATQLASTSTYVRSFNTSWTSWVRLDT